MTAKLIRHPDQLALVGSPTSAGAAAAGVENGPEAFRAAGIAARLREVGYQVTDMGDLAVQLCSPDPENPRARNVKSVLAALDALRVRIEQSSKAHALPVVLGGDVSVAVAVVAGLRRQAPSLGLIHLGRHADLHTPTKTEDGLVAPMTVSHLIGQGAPELVRFWKEPPLVREPDLALFGLAEPDAIDRERLAGLAIRRFPVERVRRAGLRASAETALERLRAGKRDFVVILAADVFSAEELPGAARGGADGLTVAEVREALNCFAARPTFAGLAVCGYDPALDPERRGAEAIVGLVAEALAARHTALIEPPAEPESTETPAPASQEETTQTEEKAPAVEKPEAAANAASGSASNDQPDQATAETAAVNSAQDSAETPGAGTPPGESEAGNA